MRMVCPAPLMLDTLVWLDDTFGGAESYLRPWACAAGRRWPNWWHASTVRDSLQSPPQLVVGEKPTCTPAARTPIVATAQRQPNNCRTDGTATWSLTIFAAQLAPGGLATRRHQH